MRAKLWRGVRQVDRAVLRLVARGAWRWRVAMAAFALVLLVSCPRPAILMAAGSVPSPAVAAKVAAPLAMQDHAPDSHEAKLAFRLAMPALVRAFGLGLPGAKLFELGCGLLLFYCLAELTFRATHSRRAAAWLTLGCAFIYAGRAAIVEYSCMYDGFALAWLLAAMVVRRPAVITGALLLAAWTDERGLIAAGLVWVYHVGQAARWRGGDWRAWWSPAALACAAAGALYAAGRLFLGWLADLHTPMGVIGWQVFLGGTWRVLPLGLWSPWEGWWLLVGAAAWTLWRRRAVALLAAAGLAAAAIAAAAFAVYDVSRSVAYALPAVPMAVAVLHESWPTARLRHWCRLGAGVCLLWPTLTITGVDLYFLGEPLPLAIIDWYDWLWRSLGWG